MKKVIRRLIFYSLKARGFKPYMASYFGGLILNDFFDNKVSLREKIWAYRRGFLSSRIRNYNLTEKNYKEYLSDYDYYKMFPLNGCEALWINDKLTTKYVFAPFDEFLPGYFFMLNDGKVTSLHNTEKIQCNISDVVEKIKEAGVLALKKESAYGGIGFYKVEFLADGFSINGQHYTEEELKSFLGSLKRYLVMEYIVAHDDIRKYYTGATGVLRMMVINEGTPQLANAYIRVGSSISGNIDAYTGSISAVVDLESGKYEDAWMHKDFDFIKVDEHPDSKIPFKGIIPRWDFVKENILKMASYVPQLKYMGFDVCVTNEGFKVYEINSHQGIELYQLSFPLLKDNPASEFFKKQIKKIKR